MKAHRIRQTASLAFGVLAVVSATSCATTPDDGLVAADVWQLTSIYDPSSGENIEIPLELRPKYTVQFGADGRLTMQLDCNRGTATWSGNFPTPGAVEPLSIGPIASTRALCPEPSFGQRMAEALSGANLQALDVDNPTLVIVSDGVRYAFKPPE